VKGKVQDFCKVHSDCIPYYFPAAMGDDSDVPYFELLKKGIPSMELYDWREKSLEVSLRFLA
jgi:hypothetical protein